MQDEHAKKHGKYKEHDKQNLVRDGCVSRAYIHSLGTSPLGSTCSRTVESALPLTIARELGVNERHVGGKSCTLSARSSERSVRACSTEMHRSDVPAASKRPLGLTLSTVPGRLDTLREPSRRQESASHATT